MKDERLLLCFVMNISLQLIKKVINQSDILIKSKVGKEKIKRVCLNNDE